MRLFNYLLRTGLLLGVYGELDVTKPDPADAPAAAMTEVMANESALRDLTLTAGRVVGFVFRRDIGSGPSTERAQYFTIWKANYGLRMNLTWSGYVVTQCQWEFSSNTTTGADGAWTAMGAPTVLTLDGSNNVTAQTVAGSLASAMHFELMTKVFKLLADFATHTGATGTAVHGLGNIAVMSAAAAALSGTSTLDGTGGVGQTTAPPVDATRIRENMDSAVSTIGIGGSTAFDAALKSYFKFTPTGVAPNTNAMTIAVPSNPPAAGKTQTITLELVNGKRSAGGPYITWSASWKWIGGVASKPDETTLEASGSNLFVATWNGTNWDISHMGKRG